MISTCAWMEEQPVFHPLINSLHILEMLYLEYCTSIQSLLRTTRFRLTILIHY